MCDAEVDQLKHVRVFLVVSEASSWLEKVAYIQLIKFLIAAFCLHLGCQVVLPTNYLELSLRPKHKAL